MDLLPESYVKLDKGNVLSGLNTPKSNIFSNAGAEKKLNLETEISPRMNTPAFGVQSIRSGYNGPESIKKSNHPNHKKDKDIPLWWYPFTLREILLKIGENSQFYIPGATKEMRMETKRNLIKKIEFIKRKKDIAIFYKKKRTNERKDIELS